jgi:hypothetical protein
MEERILLITEMGTFTPAVFTIENRITGVVKKFYLKELEMLAKGEMELSQEDKEIIVKGYLTDLWNEGEAWMQAYLKELDNGTTKLFSKIILSREDVTKGS